MTIRVTYQSIDHYRETRRFKTLDGAQRYAHRRIGARPEIGSHYAVSGDGVGKITVDGATIAALFPDAAHAEPREAEPAQRFEVKYLAVDELGSHHCWCHLAYLDTYDQAKAYVDDAANQDFDDVRIIALTSDAADEMQRCEDAAEAARLSQVHRAPGCTCSDAQLIHVGCDCMPF